MLIWFDLGNYPSYPLAWFMKIFAYQAFLLSAAVDCLTVIFPLKVHQTICFSLFTYYEMIFQLEMFSLILLLFDIILLRRSRSEIASGIFLLLTLLHIYCAKGKNQSEKEKGRGKIKDCYSCFCLSGE